MIDILTKLKTFDQQTMVTPLEFAKVLGIKILDHDGWKGDITKPITILEFRKQISNCKIRK